MPSSDRPTDHFDIDGKVDDRIEGTPLRLCLCGCGQPTPLAVRGYPERGYRKGEPTLYVRGHFRRRGKPLASRYAVNADTGCWEWLGPVGRWGYAQVTHEGRVQRAHRVFYRVYVGEIPDGLHLDHLCRNRSCVNPAHLEPVTHAENVRRGANAKLTREQVIEIRRSAERNVDIAARYGVSATTVCDIRRGRKWRDLGDEDEVLNAD